MHRRPLPYFRYRNTRIAANTAFMPSEITSAIRHLVSRCFTCPRISVARFSLPCILFAIETPLSYQGLVPTGSACCPSGHKPLALFSGFTRLITITASLILLQSISLPGSRPGCPADRTLHLPPPHALQTS